MTFKDIKKGHPVYMLHKGDEGLREEIGRVTAITQPRFPQYSGGGTALSTVVDVTVETNGANNTYTMPASYFYQLCWIYRIPFVYLIGVNVIRMFYGSWLITNEMYDADLILIILTCALYVYAFATRQCWRIGKLFIRKGRK